MSKSKKQLHNELRANYMALVREAIANNGDDVLATNSNEFAIPCVDSEGNEEFVVITFKVPTGSRDGTPYDGYGEAEGYAQHLAEAEEKAAKNAEAKAKKIAKDKAAREAKAKAKAEYEAKAKG
jgi:nucleoid-associated protein YgaU